MWVIYLIQHSLTKEIYIGITGNFRRRIVEHNEGKQKATRRKKGYWCLVYAEAYRSKKDAQERERKLKYQGRAKHGLKKRIQRSFLGD